MMMMISHVHLKKKNNVRRLTGVCFSISEYGDHQRQFVEANQLDTATALTNL